MRIVTQRTTGGPEVLEVGRAPVPEPLPTEIRVRVAAAGVNPVDWKTRAGGGMATVIGPPPLTLTLAVPSLPERFFRSRLITALSPAAITRGVLGSTTSGARTVTLPSALP